MERNRDARRTPVSTSNGVSRRRHRGNGFRDSPEEEMPMEFHEAAKPRDRSVLKKERDRDRGRDRDRDRDRDRCSRSKRRRGERHIHGSGREDIGGDESTDESVNDFEDFDEDEDSAAQLRLIPHLPPILMNSHQRKSFPPAKIYRSTQAWKNNDEIIGFSVPRKARSASTKRSHENWIAGGVQSASPARHAVVGSSPATVSPSSSNASARKKTKGIGGKNRGRKSMSKSPPSSNQDEIEFEIAEVLYGLRQNHGAKGEAETTTMDLMKFDCRDSPISSNCNPKISSRASPPTVSVVAPKRKRPRQPKCEEEYPPSLLTERVSSLSCSTKADQEQLQKPGPCSSPLTEKSPRSENGVHISVVDAVNQKSESKPVENHVVSIPEEEEQAPIKKESKEIPAVFGVGDQGEEKIQFLIDLMAPPPPPQIKPSPERESKHPHSTVKLHSSTEEHNQMEFKSQLPIPRSNDPMEDTLKITLDIGLDMDKRGGKNTNTVKQHSLPQPHLHLKPCGEQRVTDTTAPWINGVHPGSYIGGVISMDSSIQNPKTLFSQPRPKRCATHCYIASSIHSHQKVVRMNPFWQPLANPSIYSKPCNAPAEEATANPVGKGVVSAQEKGPDVCVFPVKDKPPLNMSNFPDSVPRTPQILLQQPPPNILQGPAAFLFPVNQPHPHPLPPQLQPTGVPSTRPSPKTAPSPSSAPSILSAPPSPVVSMSFSYPSVPPTEPQYLAILQNNLYSFSVPPYRPPSHPHVLPFFNSPLYSPPILHPPPPPSRHLPLPKSRPSEPSREDSADSRRPPPLLPSPDKRPKKTLRPDDPDTLEEEKKNSAKSIAFSRPDPNHHRQMFHLPKPHPSAVTQRGKILTMNNYPGPSPPWKNGGSSAGKPVVSSQNRGGQISFGPGAKVAPATSQAVVSQSSVAPAGASSSLVKNVGKGPPSSGGRLAMSVSGKPPPPLPPVQPIELSKQAWQQAQLFFSGPFGQVSQPGPPPSGVYFTQRRRTEQGGVGVGSVSSSSSTSSMLSLCSPPPVTSDPGKTASSKGAVATQFSFPHMHSLPQAMVVQQQQQQQQGKSEQKQTAGE